jgi:amidophosphoribosyltransferase
MLVSCPPHRFPCYYGIDFSNLGELIASRFSVEEIRRYLGLDSLHYLSLEGLLKSVNGEQNRFCLACFDGNYPLPLEEEFSKFCLEKGKS